MCAYLWFRRKSTLLKSLRLRVEICGSQLIVLILRIGLHFCTGIILGTFFPLELRSRLPGSPKQPRAASEFRGGRGSGFSVHLQKTRRVKTLLYRVRVLDPIALLGFQGCAMTNDQHSP